MRFSLAMAGKVIFLMSVSLRTQILAQAPALVPVLHLTDAPFTATLVEVDRSPEKVTTLTKQLARSSNGSAYMAESIDGRLFRISIDDIPNDRSITLAPSPPSYTYLVSPPPGGKFRTFSMEENRKQLQWLQDLCRRKPDYESTRGKTHRVPLGVQIKDGMAIFGETDESISDTGEKRTSESWLSELGVRMSLRTDSSTEGHYETETLTELRRVEPDPRLFQIPPEYLPHPDALLDAKTVFIENQTGDQRVEDGAKEGFENWKRLAVTTSKQDADLIAVFSNRYENSGAPAEAAIEMKIYRPGSGELLYTSNLIANRRTPSRTEGSPDAKAVARSCVGSLQNRIANTHIGPANVHIVAH
jgi:hypothetical protein